MQYIWFAIIFAILIKKEVESKEKKLHENKYQELLFVFCFYFRFNSVNKKLSSEMQKYRWEWQPCFSITLKKSANKLWNNLDKIKLFKQY